MAVLAEVESFAGAAEASVPQPGEFAAATAVAADADVPLGAGRSVKCWLAEVNR